MIAPHREREMRHFLLLTRDEQHEAIQRLKNSGMADETIAAATMLSVEFVRKIIGRARAEAAAPS